LRCVDFLIARVEYTGKSRMSQHVIAAVDDMFFAAKIRATAEHLGLDVRFLRGADDVIARAHEDRPALIIVDLHARRCDPFALAEKLKADEALRDLTLIGFFSHVQTELQHRAEQAGFDRVMPRSVFTRQLAEILQNGTSDKS
jgi:PleD family two-component response regulator